MLLFYDESIAFATNINENNIAIGGQMTENQQKILSLIIGNNKINRKEIANKIEINESAIQKQLKNLIRLGVIERVGGTRGFWKIKKS